MAVYQSTFLSPRNIAINASANYLMSCIMQGTIILNYRIKIYDNSDDSLDYDSGVVDISSTPLYNGETLEHLLAANTLVNGKEYKWQIITSDGTNSATSSFALFRTNALPVITFTPPSSITSQSYTFNATYSQAQNVPVNYTQFLFYNINNELILTTGKNYTGRIQYTYEGFANNTSYGVKIIGYTSNNVYFETGIYNFTIEYSQPNVNLTPIITQGVISGCKSNSLVNIEWGGIVQETGVATGTISYSDGCISDNSMALNIANSSSYVTFTVDFPSEFSYIFEWKPVTFTSGIIAKLVGSVQYDFGYDGTKFYLTVNGSTFVSPLAPLEYPIDGTLFPSELLFPSETLFPSGGYDIYPFLVMLTDSGARIKVKNTLYKIEIAL